MSHVIKINCGENHQMPAFGCTTCRLGPWGRSWSGRCQAEGQTGLPSQHGTQGCPLRPLPFQSPWCSLIWPVSDEGSHPLFSNSLSTVMYHHQITDTAPETKAGAIGFPRKRCFAESNLQLIGIKLLYQPAWEYGSALDRFRGQSPRRRDASVCLSDPRC